MAKTEYLGSVTRTIAAAIMGGVIGHAVQEYNITPETLESILTITEKVLNSVYTIGSLVGLAVVQGWSVHQKMTKNNEINTLKKEIKYND